MALTTMAAAATVALLRAPAAAVARRCRACLQARPRLALPVPSSRPSFAVRPFMPAAAPLRALRADDMAADSYGGAVEKEAAKVFVGNLSWNTNAEELGEMFQAECGKVVDAYIPMGQDGRPKGIGFVEFASPESARAAVEMLNMAEFDGRNIVVELANVSRSRERRGGERGGDRGGERRERKYDSPASPSQRVFVGSLSYDTTWEVLKDFFKQAGNVTYASVSTREDGSSKGCGVVQFSTVEEAQNAISMLDGAELDGRQIFVREDRKEPRRTGRTPRREYRQEARDGDWECPNCGANCFASKTECYKCGTSRY